MSIISSFSGRGGARRANLLFLFGRLDFKEPCSNWVIEGIKLSLKFSDIIETNPKTNNLFDIVKFDLVICGTLEISLKFKGKNSKSLSDDLWNKILESIGEFEFSLAFLSCSCLLELFGHVFNTIKEEFRLFIFGLKEVNHIRNTNEMWEPFRVEFISNLFGKVFWW